MAKSKKKQQSSSKKSSSKRAAKKDLQKQLQAIVAEANAQENPLQALPPAFLSAPLSPPSPSSVGRSNDDDDDDRDKSSSRAAAIRHLSSPLPPNVLKQCLELFEANMGEMYRSSSWGLDMEEKERELRHAGARFLVALAFERDDSGGDEDGAEHPRSDSAGDEYDACAVLGFAHFRHEVDEDATPRVPVTYVYELQVRPSHQKLGLGKRLMTLIELMALRMGMRKVMLTVFRANDAAMKFYEKRKYQVDECSPSNFDGEESENCEYEIMSKPLGGGSSGPVA
ncbi:hypothetical protein ACHAWF_005228 [Thalassiosira exigua]